MTAGMPPSTSEKPHIWDETQTPPPESLRLWAEVGSGLERSQTVVWKSAVDSLDHANKYLQVSGDARLFVEKYMSQIISILVEQQPAKIGPHERNCVQDSLALAVMIVSKDLEIQLQRNGECKFIETLSLVFNKKKAYYKGSKGNWNVNHLSGLPEIRRKMIERFRQEQGFKRLYRYMMERINTPLFPNMDALHQILSALLDALPNHSNANDQIGAKEMEDAAIEIGEVTTEFIHSLSDAALKKLASEHLSTVLHNLQRIFDKLVSSRRESTYVFYAFWRALIFKLITAQSLPLKLFGWQQVDDLLSASADHRPPPRAFDVSGAGCSFVNGKYVFAGITTKGGYAQRGVDITYERKIPETEEDGAGKKLTLFRCTMRSQQKWWFLSEADEEQPGTDRDIDYYQHKSKEHEETEPPPRGWITCRNAGVEPPPQLKANGLVVPAGEEYDTLEHQLAKWAIEKGIIELVLGDSVHREIVSRSTALMKFLASMCERDDGVETVGQKRPNLFCLQSSHLLLAWKTCTRKADAAVATQVYQLLVSILPSCPASLSIPLLKEVQQSLSIEKGDYLTEVAEFCSALAAANSADAKSASTVDLSADVRAEVLELLWSVLIHPDASSLREYENLKKYVTNELRVEPKGSEHRESYLRSCIVTLMKNSNLQSGDSVDESQALCMVRLTHFVLMACPRAQASLLVMKDSNALPNLLFKETTSYLKRRKNGTKINPSLRKEKEFEINPLAERLQILRSVFGQSTETFMSSLQLKELWELCNSAGDREELMIFIASSSGSGVANSANKAQEELVSAQQTIPSPDDVLSAAFTEEVCAQAFLQLFCSAGVSFQLWGEGAYRSFQFMFNKLRISPLYGKMATTSALDTLWRICLDTGNDTVANQAMSDLLTIYVADSASWQSLSPSDRMDSESPQQTFGKRVFDCLTNVKRGLDNKEPTAELASERCLRILNAAIGQGVAGGSITPSTLNRLTSSSPPGGLRDTVKYLPHGMRGQACYRNIGILAKRANAQQSVNNQSNLEGEPAATSANQARGLSTFRFSLDLHPLETLQSIKTKVAAYCQCSVISLKPISVSGRALVNGSESTQLSLNVVPDESVVDELGIIEGCEIVFVIADRPMHSAANVNAANTRNTNARDISDIFYNDGDGFPDKLFQTLLGILEALPWTEPDAMSDVSVSSTDAHKLVWDLILAMPTNAAVAAQVLMTAQNGRGSEDEDMEIDSPAAGQWSKLLDLQNFHRSVYVLLAIDAFLQPASEVLSCLPLEQQTVLEREMAEEATAFRKGFIESGGLGGVVSFFSAPDSSGMSQSMTRMGNAVALRILKCCLFGNRSIGSQDGNFTVSLNEAGARLLQSLSDAEGLLRSLTAMVVGDSGISAQTILDVLKFLKLLFQSPTTAKSFVTLPNGMAESFLITLLLWEGGIDSSRPASSVHFSAKVRKNTHDLILSTPALRQHAFPWLIEAINGIEVTSDATSEYFDALQKLVAANDSATNSQVCDLATAVCKKLASYPRPSSESAMVDFVTGVLCGCLTLIRALIEKGEGKMFQNGTAILVNDLGVERWSDLATSPNKGMFSLASNNQSKPEPNDLALIDLMGIIFDGFLSPRGSSSVAAICCDKESRQRGFDVVGAAARSCVAADGYLALVTRINGLVSSAAPFLKHRWGQVAGGDEVHTRIGRNSSQYSGLKNQGCTCYMNSVLQQMFMMPELRKSMCSAPLPASIRASGSVAGSKGIELVGKKVAMQWENGISYDAIVEGFDKETGMHSIRYCPMQVAIVAGASHHQVQAEDIDRLPPLLQEEFFLSDGRPGKETGVFEIVTSVPEEPKVSTTSSSQPEEGVVHETEDESASRHLMEEFQRTLIHLEEGSRGRCFDPKALVEACACLKLEFDVWQQNDASEFLTKLLDRLETSLKRWAPEHFRYLDHTFGLKQTKQKICKECGMKTNREQNMLNLDCQIRGKADIHEALGTMTEEEIMEGNNQVFCDSCKKNTDTVLRTAISSLPNMLILSLKRFDLDYNTFETVKLNSRCAFGQTLNMKRYTLEGLEAMEQAGIAAENQDSSAMDIEDETALRHLPDDDYEYKLAGVLVHAGVAQGGHYYSFIKDRNPGSEEKWYRFDDEDVTPFDQGSIEVECFGGKIKKETKWPNGQVQTVETEQYANALMLFYEKVKTTDTPPASEEQIKDAKKNAIPSSIVMTSGYDVFEPDVQRSNATHKCQTFLFDAEFQTFLKGLLGLCRMSSPMELESDGDMAAVALDKSSQLWRGSVIQMLLTYMFDIFLYSNERRGMEDWVEMLEEVMAIDKNSARSFMVKLASKTREVSGNWLRTFLSDCPVASARTAAARVYTAAIKSCLTLPDEQQKLDRWTQAWKEQLAAMNDPIKEALPCMLEGEWKTYEDPQEPGASAIGVIVSFTNILIDASPRIWRFSPELTYFVRNLAMLDSRFGGDKMRQAMVESLVPARLSCLVTRERSPPQLRVAFPGASVAIEVADTQVRPEQSPTQQLMTLHNSAVLNPPDANYRGGGSPIDFLFLFEALGYLLGIRGVMHVPLTVEVGRQQIVLSKPAIAALRVVFEESCAPSTLGMGQREIELYLQRCGLDHVPTQKIVDIMAKYPTTANGNGAQGPTYLSLEGFVAYYRDTAQTNEARVRHDLHTFGFRPDLSRRPVESRIFAVQGREQPRTTAESVTYDCTNYLKDSRPNLGKFTESALSSFALYSSAYSASEPLAENMLAGATCGKNTNALIIDTLRAIYAAPAGWVGSETLNAAIMVLRVLASIPDERQKDRIMFMMQCPERPTVHTETGLGLMVAARSFYNARATHTYQNELHYAFDRYVSILKDLLGLRPIYVWMTENRALWNWMERELLDSPQQVQSSQTRTDYASRRTVPVMPLDHHHSDTDDNMPDMNDSEDEDDDSQFDDMDPYQQDIPNRVIVGQAGNPAVNGVYARDGAFERAYKFSRVANYNGKPSLFSIFQCNVSNNTKHWYISIVPPRGQPGTSVDLDFYSAPVTEGCTTLPPLDGWTNSTEGREHPPILHFSQTKPEEQINRDIDMIRSSREDDLA